MMVHSTFVFIGGYDRYYETAGKKGAGFPDHRGLGTPCSGMRIEHIEPCLRAKFVYDI